MPPVIEKIFFISIINPTMNPKITKITANLRSFFRAAGKRRIDTILPQARKYGDVHTLLLPHDPDYSLAVYKQPPRPGETSRVAFRDKMWRTEVGAK